jgi:hypothetical protein
MNWKILAVVPLAMSLVACENMNRQQQRMLSGAGIGAAGGLALTAITGGSLLTGAAVGAAGGAVVGALTSDSGGSGGKKKHHHD